MTPHAYAHQSDSESLQADVMRFMAIIAFCLIAILALVRHAEPAAEPAPATAAPAPAPADTTAQPAAAPAAPEPSTWRQPLPKAEPAPATPPRTPRPAPKPRRLEAQAVAAAEAPARPEAPPAAAEPSLAQAAEDEGLSLRFASDGDFLRLIAKGDIRVYAFRDADVLTLTSAYDFLSARSPGQLHELMPQTIPSVIVDALVMSRREQGDSNSFSWGITLPAAIQQQISGLVATVASGQLVIDRYGDVHHVASR